MISTDVIKIEELLSRGVENIFPNTDFLRARLLRGEKLTLYLGIDPTGESLHFGHVIPLLKLRTFQQLGHQIILLMGDFTAMIGDPTDKTAARKKLTHVEVMQNLTEYKKQASKYIDFEGDNPKIPKALFKFNSEWLSKLSFGDVLELCSLVTVDQMLKRDMFSTRQAEGKPIFIHEFMYPLMQGYDSVAMDVDGEVGGNDQTFNMLMGRDLLKTIKSKEKFVLTSKLLTDASGKKMGKTEGNMVKLNSTPEEMFGGVMSWIDGLILPGFELLTEINTKEIEQIKNNIENGENPKDSKIKLAFTLVADYFGIDAAQRALENFENTFAKGGIPEDIIEVEVGEGTLLVDVCLERGVIESKSEFRRLVEEGAVTNLDTGMKIETASEVARTGVYKIGKRRFIKIR